jgi:hypothetical protein
MCPPHHGLAWLLLPGAVSKGVEYPRPNNAGEALVAGHLHSHQLAVHASGSVGWRPLGSSSLQLVTLCSYALPSVCSTSAAPCLSLVVCLLCHH